MINYFRVPFLSILLSNLTLLRVMQAGMIAAVIPLVISAFTNDGGEGPLLGFLNSGRFSGNTFGSMLATILAQSVCSLFRQFNFTVAIPYAEKTDLQPS